MPGPILLLASASPRRAELLTQLGATFTVAHIPAGPGPDEPILPGECALDYVQRTARDKANLAVNWLARQKLLTPQHAILCADTTVELDEHILGKPDNLDHAAQILQTLSGRTHHVHTALVLVQNGQYYFALSSSKVEFATLSSDEILRYCATQEPMGKAGAYGIQGPAGAFVRHLSGSYSGVMGLPLHECYTLLKAVGITSFQ